MGKRKAPRGRGRPSNACAESRRTSTGIRTPRKRVKTNASSGDGEASGNPSQQGSQQMRSASGPGQLEVSSTPQPEVTEQQQPSLTGEVVHVSSANNVRSIGANIETTSSRPSTSSVSDSANGNAGALLPAGSFPSIVPRPESLALSLLEPMAGCSSSQPSQVVLESQGNRGVDRDLAQNDRDGSSRLRVTFNEPTVGSQTSPPGIIRNAPEAIREGAPNVSSINPNQLGGEALGTAVPQSTKEKIWRGDYVDFNGLVGDQGVATHPVGDQQGFTMVQAGHQIMFKPIATRNKVTNIELWTNAFLVYSSIYLQAHPNKAQALLKYCSLIRSAANRYTGYGWRDYDIQYRSRIARIDQAWEKIDGELWLMYVVGGGSPKLGGFNPLSGSRQVVPGRGGSATPASSFPRHWAGGWRQGSGQRQGARSVGSPQTPNTSGVCYELNFGPGTCTRQHCRFLHKCVACGNVGHGKVRCPKIRQAKGNPNAK